MRSRVVYERVNAASLWDNAANRPHPSPNTDKGVVASIRRWLESNDISPELMKEQTDDEQSNDD